jgi:hypothetical protein
MHAVDVFTLLTATASIFPHYSIMVYSLLFNLHLFVCITIWVWKMNFDLMDTRKNLGEILVTMDIQPTGLSLHLLALTWTLFTVSSICIKLGAVDLYLGRIEQTPN